MALELVTIPCRSDNYAFLVHDHTSNKTALVDAPEAAPIQKALDARGWTLNDIWITHHHDDHIDGVEALRTNARVIGAAADAHRLPGLDLAISEGDSVDFAGHPMQIFDVSGHTIGHLAFYLEAANVVFTADSLMALGCGRLFEGTPDQMWNSLMKLAALPPNTIVCSGHEYTSVNAQFALTIEPTNPELLARVDAITKARQKGEPTVPSVLSQELATNPFLRAGLQQVKTGLDMSEASDSAVFAEIRSRKDRF